MLNTQLPLYSMPANRPTALSYLRLLLVTVFLLATANFPYRASTLNPGPAMAVEEAMPPITGRVLDAAGHAVVGARVLVIESREVNPGFINRSIMAFGQANAPTEWEAVTSEDGRFELYGPKPGRVELRVHAQGYAQFDRGGRTLPAVAGADFGDLVLEQGIRLEGRVLSRGVAIPGAELIDETPRDRGFSSFRDFRRRWLYDFGSIPPIAICDDQGAFQIDTLPSGPWRLRVHAEDHVDAILTGYTELPGQSVESFEVELDRGLSISGRVLGIASDQHLDMHVRAELRTLKALQSQRSTPGLKFTREIPIDGDGTFVLNGLRQNDLWRLQVRDRKGAGNDVSLEGVRSDAVEALAGDSAVKLRLSRTSSFEFKVVDATTGLAIEQLRVVHRFGPTTYMHSEGAPLEQHDGGIVLIKDVSANTKNGASGDCWPWSILVDAPGYKYMARTFEMRDGESDPIPDFELELIEPLEPTLVTVLDDRTGAPIAGAQTALWMGRWDNPFAPIDFRVRAATDATGLAVLDSNIRGHKRALFNGTFESRLGSLTVTHPDYMERVLEDLVLPVGLPLEIEVRMDRGGVVSVVATDANGEPFPGARIEWRRTADGVQDDAIFHGGSNPRPWPIYEGGTSDGAGHIRFEHLPTDSLEFRIAGRSAKAYFSNGPEPTPNSPWSELLVRHGEEHVLTLKRLERSTMEGYVSVGGKQLAGAKLILTAHALAEVPPYEGLPTSALRAQGWTDGAGAFHLGAVEPGAYEVVVTHHSRIMPMRTQVELAPGGNRQDLELAKTEVRGRVIDSEGNPLTGVSIQIGPSDKYAFEPPYPRHYATTFEPMITISSSLAVTDSDGRFSLPGIVGGTELAIHAKHSGWVAVKTDPFQVKLDESRSLADIELRRAGSLSVSIPDFASKDVTYVQVTALYRGSESGAVAAFKVTSDFTKGWSIPLTGLLPGPWELRVSVNYGAGVPPENLKPIPAEVVVDKDLRIEVQSR